MPTIEQNHQYWNTAFPWIKEGDEWSLAWGSAINQWHTLILPRIYRFLPSHHILEIAPGHGRWTQFLLKYTDRLSVVDLSENCIAHCRTRFTHCAHIEYHVNNGRSLEGIPDDSVGFVFSFDSLVHADYDVMCDYLKEIKRVLCPGGCAVIHHSNLGARHNGFAAKLKRRILKLPMLSRLRQKRSSFHWRSASVSADLILRAAQRIQLTCTGQEIFRWFATRRKTDCISVFWNGDGVALESTRFDNAFFQADVVKSLQLQKCYRRVE